MSWGRLADLGAEVEPFPSVDSDRRASRRSAWRWRVGTVDPIELVEDASLMLRGNAWPRIGHADVEVAVDRLGGHAHGGSPDRRDGEVGACQAFDPRQAGGQ